VDKNLAQVHLKPPSSRQEEPEKNPFPWRKRKLEKECATSHSNILVEAWKRETKR
jgi:hypothetical protein